MFFNRGGGPLLSHIALTGITFLILCVCLSGEKKFNLNFPPRMLFILYFGVIFNFISLVARAVIRA